MNEPYRVQLESYEGPLDLLLDLIRKQEIAIYDIPIAQITGQYLGYLQQHLEQLDTEAAGEFILMAATLIHIKSKMLLPPDPSNDSADQEDPRAELVHQLLEHEKFKNAAQMLDQKHVVQNALWSAPTLKPFLDPQEEPGLAVTLFDLVKAFQQILERAKDKPEIAFPEEQVSVAEMMRQICDMLAARSEPVVLGEVFSRLRSREALVVSFLALLELVRLQAVRARQKELFGEIALVRHTMFAAVYSESQTEVDQSYQ